MSAALRLKHHPFEDIFARSTPTALEDDASPRDDSPPEDRRDVVVRIPGRQAEVIPVVDGGAGPDGGAPAELSSTIDVHTPPAFDFLYDPPLGSVRYRVSYGGRGSAKSWQFARALLVHGRTRRIRVLCAREYQSSIKDSVHKLLSDQIRALTLQTFYTVTQTSIVGKNGTEFIFKGIRKNADEIKSTEGIDVCWVEEAHSVTGDSWEVLIPTIRKEGSEIWVSFNPALPTDSTYKRYVLEPPPAKRAIVRKVSWRDNPWLPQVLRDEEQELLQRDPEAHAHVWGGEPWSRSDAQVLAGKWRVDDFDPVEQPYGGWDGPYFGADWGFASDPTIIVKLWLHDGALWLEHAEGKPKLDNDATERLFRDVPGGDLYVIRADNSRPETINEMAKRQLRVEPADKWPGSVEDGIAHLRSYRAIVIHPRCARAIEEARLWRYKVDPRTKDVLPQLQPGHDHVWDAVRYALEPMIRVRSGAWGSSKAQAGPVHPSGAPPVHGNGHHRGAGRGKVRVRLRR
jgi:phage terminase large subunit